MSQNINDLRSAMFETLQALKKGAITVEQARAVSDIGKVIIDSAKVEVDYIRANKGGLSDFIDPQDLKPLPDGVVGATRHRLVG